MSVIIADGISIVFLESTQDFLESIHNGIDKAVSYVISKEVSNVNVEEVFNGIGYGVPKTKG